MDYKIQIINIKDIPCITYRKFSRGECNIFELPIFDICTFLSAYFDEFRFFNSQAMVITVPKEYIEIDTRNKFPIFILNRIFEDFFAIC